jgi:hypothetical protein
MSPAPSPETTTPADPTAYRPRRRGPGLFLIGLFGLGCAIVGALLAMAGSRLLASRPHPGGLFDAPPAAVAPAASLPAPAAQGPAAPPAAAEPDGQLDELAARLDAVESRSGRTSQAAASALAAAVLVEATQQSGPFAEELTALRGVAPASPELAALAAVAETGAPTRAALAESFPDYAARAASASRTPGDGSGLGDRIVYVLSRIVTLRRVAEVQGNSTDALLAQAERQVEDGDLNRALGVLDRLPQNAREAMAPWRLRAERRAQVDRAAAALRARAIQDLTSARSGA